jgi:hypothetical protein
MSFSLFHDFFPELAEKETRSVSILGEAAWDLPPGNYALLEMFCDEVSCDCRRVMFYVISDRYQNMETVVSYGWESYDFYAKWLNEDNPEIVQCLIGPCLNVGSPQSQLSPRILEMVRFVLEDGAFVDRVKRHYQMFRERIDRKKKSITSKKKGSVKRKKR